MLVIKSLPRDDAQLGVRLGFILTLQPLGMNRLQSQNKIGMFLLRLDEDGRIFPAPLERILDFFKLITSFINVAPRFPETPQPVIGIEVNPHSEARTQTVIIKRMQAGEDHHIVAFAANAARHSGLAYDRNCAPEPNGAPSARGYLR